MGVGDGVIGNTADFGSVVEGSSPSPRASVPDLALYGDESAGAVTLRRRGTYSSIILPAPCRKCGGPSWKADDEGSIHPCCELMWTEAGGCLSCRTSEVLNREHRRRHSGSLVRLPAGG